MLTCLELCAGAGGQALGLEAAGYEHLMLVDNDPHCCATLKLNRPQWNVLEADIGALPGQLKFEGRLDLLAAGLPCPPFSIAGKKLGAEDERNLFPAALELIAELRPPAVMIENVKGFLEPRFKRFRQEFRDALEALGYRVDWRMLHASDFGVPQLRPRVVIVAAVEPVWEHFRWPTPPVFVEEATVGDALLELMSEGGWEGAAAWAEKARRVAPTIVGGSKKHGGPDLGPTRARQAWAELGVDGRTLAEDPPPRSFTGMPRLTVPMVARLQGFPSDWRFSGRKTAAYRQVGNAFPPPVAEAVARRIRAALNAVQPERKAS